MLKHFQLKQNMKETKDELDKTKDDNKAVKIEKKLKENKDKHLDSEKKT